jgi:hypothetical protein
MRNYDVIMINKKDLIRLYIKEHKTIKQIALIYGCASLTIASRLNKYNIPMSKRKTWKEIIIKKELYKLYVIDMISARSIAKIYKCTSTTVNSRLKETGILSRLSEEKRKQIKLKRIAERTIIKNSPESKLKQSISMKSAYANNPEISIKKRKAMKKCWDTRDSECNDRIIKTLNESRNESWKNKDGRKIRIDALLKTWQNADTKEKHIKATMLGNQARPTRPEIAVKDILDRLYPNEYAYNGDCSQGVVLAGLVPDFIDVNGKKQIVEVFGDVFHNPELFPFGGELNERRTDKGRIEAYKTIGWNCLIMGT